MIAQHKIELFPDLLLGHIQFLPYFICTADTSITKTEWRFTRSTALQRDFLIGFLMIIILF